MRCLNCRQDGISPSVEVCPKCGIHLPTLMRDVLPAGTSLHGGAYRIDYVLGRGGFGITYRAIHSKLEQLVAIKEFFPDEHALREGKTGAVKVASSSRDNFLRGLQRFEKEGRILATVNHPNVVSVKHLFDERGTAYLVMDLVTGKTLKDELETQPKHCLAVDRVRALMGQIVSALEAVHEQGVYHLDIKPDNVVLASELRPVLIDFGAARQGFSSRSTQAFTIEYAPPEVLAGSDVGPESDIFELGMMLHEMLTGVCPPSSLSRMVKDGWRPAIVDQPWCGLLTSALQLNKEARPSNVRDWWQATEVGLPKKLKNSRVSTPVATFATLGVGSVIVALMLSHHPESQSVSASSPNTSVASTNAFNSSSVKEVVGSRHREEDEQHRAEAEQSATSAKKLNNKLSAKLSTLQDQQQRGLLTEENAVMAKAQMKPLLEEALADSEHAISLDSNNKDAWFQRVCTLYFWGKYPEADQYLRQATAKFPDCNDFDPLRPLIEKHLR